MKLNNDLGDAPNIHYKKLFDKFEEIESLDIKSWHSTHVLAYFCKKYLTHYSTKYKFKYNSSSPSKCFEVFQIKKLGLLLSSDPQILIEYIDWLFDKHVIKAKRKLTSISFMTHENIINDYKLNILLSCDNKNIQRTKSVPINYTNIFKEFGFDVLTYGQLAFVFQIKDEQSNKAFDKIKLIGFTEDIVDNII